MKRILLVIPAILLMIAGSFSSCGMKEKNGMEMETEIGYTEYSLAGTDCQWTNLAYDNKIIVINSKSELVKYVVCTEGTYPEIDFSQNTLLLVHGAATSNVVEIHKKLIQNNDYTLHIKVYVGILGVAQGWDIAIISTKKIKENNIHLDIEYLDHLKD